MHSKQPTDSSQTDAFLVGAQDERPVFFSFFSWTSEPDTLRSLYSDIAAE